MRTHKTVETDSAPSSPPSAEEVIASLDAVRAEYPGASVFASTFDNFIRAVEPVANELPVVTSEIGCATIPNVRSACPEPVLAKGSLSRACLGKSSLHFIMKGGNSLKENAVVFCPQGHVDLWLRVRSVEDGSAP
jgi:hypothetical protein